MNEPGLKISPAHAGLLDGAGRSSTRYRVARTTLFAVVAMISATARGWDTA
jgi:hypothetical protein